MPPREPELRLRRCLDARTRRWAAAEFFYSGLDRAWFIQNELLVCSFCVMCFSHASYETHL